jgi:hypothetical protein
MGMTVQQVVTAFYSLLAKTVQEVMKNVQKDSMWTEYIHNMKLEATTQNSVRKWRKQTWIDVCYRTPCNTI